MIVRPPRSTRSATPFPYTPIVLSPPDPYGAHGRFDPVHRVDRKLGGKRDIVVATVVPGGDTSSITLACEPETASWTDWLRVDHGANLETIEAITRAITRRVAEHRRGEKDRKSTRLNSSH